MSLRIYSSAPELTGASKNALKAGRLKITVAALKAGRRTYRQVRVPVLGTSDANLIANMVAVVEKIESVSAGKIVSVEMEMGHYRYDEVLPELGNNRASTTVTFKTMSGRALTVKIPYTGDVKPSEVYAAMDSLLPTDATTKDAKIGYVRWNNRDNPTALVTDQVLTCVKAVIFDADDQGELPPSEFDDAPGVADYHLGDAGSTATILN